MAETENVNELLQIRRDKLKELQEAGKNPFVITKYNVTHHSVDIKNSALWGKPPSVIYRI